MLAPQLAIGRKGRYLIRAQTDSAQPILHERFIMTHPRPKTNIAEYLPEAARRFGDRPAVHYRGQTVSFAELETRSAAFACELRNHGVDRGMRILTLLRPGPDFIAAVFAVFRIGAAPVLIDPGMGRANFLACVRQTGPEAMVGIAKAHWLALLFPGTFRCARRRFAVGAGSPPWVRRLDRCRQADATYPVAPTHPEDVAAIVFTTGSTGPPKGVVYTHRIFVTQTELIRDVYGAGPDHVDMPAFPLFALFSAALGMPCAIPEMDPSRPAEADPAVIVQTLQRHGVTFSFASPALWRRVGAWCRAEGIRLPTLRQVLMAGAPVPADLHALVKSVIADHGETLVPYGATEALPIANLTGSEVLADTGERSARGEGYCVGRPLPGMTIRIIRPTEEPISEWDDRLALPPGERGEIVVHGPVVTPHYCDLPDHTAMAKIRDPRGGLWHRMGDVGYLDNLGRLWFCGRKAHRVLTSGEPLYSVCCEAIFNRHPRVFRSALVGIGEPGHQRPVILIEPHPGEMPHSPAAQHAFVRELRELAATAPFTADLDTFLFHPAFPVDIRHNAKIFREQLAVWAEERMQK
jgi:acyl-CoA synthetase (AMP-forming)/AMP-acid ligase II